MPGAPAATQARTARRTFGSSPPREFRRVATLFTFTLSRAIEARYSVLRPPGRAIRQRVGDGARQVAAHDAHLHPQVAVAPSRDGVRARALRVDQRLHQAVALDALRDLRGAPLWRGDLARGAAAGRAQRAPVHARDDVVALHRDAELRIGAVAVLQLRRHDLAHDRVEVRERAVDGLLDAAHLVGPPTKRQLPTTPFPACACSCRGRPARARARRASSDGEGERDGKRRKTRDDMSCPPLAISAVRWPAHAFRSCCPSTWTPCSC
jgi:hypothetical protein